jgi:hypothetical protein
MKRILLIVCLRLLVAGAAGAQTWDGSLMKVDYRGLVSRADLSYNTPVVRSEEGLPIGNGRTGSLVWTTPTALHFQVNQVDLFCMGHNTLSFPKGHTDYSSGCGYVDIILYIMVSCSRGESMPRFCGMLWGGASIAKATGEDAAGCACKNTADWLPCPTE